MYACIRKCDNFFLQPDNNLPSTGNEVIKAVSSGLISIPVLSSRHVFSPRVVITTPLLSSPLSKPFTLLFAPLSCPFTSYVNCLYIPATNCCTIYWWKYSLLLLLAPQPFTFSYNWLEAFRYGSLSIPFPFFPDPFIRHLDCSLSIFWLHWSFAVVSNVILIFFTMGLQHNTLRIIKLKYSSDTD